MILYLSLNYDRNIQTTQNYLSHGRLHASNERSVSRVSKGTFQCKMRWIVWKPWLIKVQWWNFTNTESLKILYGRDYLGKQGQKNLKRARKQGRSIDLRTSFIRKTPIWVKNRPFSFEWNALIWIGGYCNGKWDR